MNKSLIIGLSLVFLPASACNQNGGSTDNEHIQGQWLFAGTVGNGKRTDATEKDKGKGILFKGDKFYDESGARKNEGKFKLDTTKKPKAIELTFSGALEGQKVSFAYELKGDNLRLTQTLEGEYVTEFDSNKWLIQEFVREKK